MKGFLNSIMGTTMSSATVSPNVDPTTGEAKKPDSVSAASSADETYNTSYEEQDLKLELLHGLIKNHQANGDHEQALAYHNEKMMLLTDEADRAQALYEEAEIHASLGDFEKAGASLDEALSLQPKSPALLKGKANLYLLMGQCNEAMKLYEKLVKSTKDTVEQTKLFYTCGRIAYKKGDLKLAIKYYLQELQSTKSTFGKAHLECSRIYHEIARMYDECCDYRRALVFLEKALKVEQLNLKDSKGEERREVAQLIQGTQKYIGRIHYNMGNFQKAMKTIRDHRI